MTKLEQVALALFDCTAEQWARKSANFREAAMKDVRRSVEALRGPADEMLTKVVQNHDGMNELDLHMAFNETLDAILSEKPE
jgi:hypothetical protein